MGAPGRAHDENRKGSGPPPRPAEPRFLAVGRVLRPHGVRGELRVGLLTDYPERLSLHRLLYLGAEPRPYEVEGVRFHQGAALIKLVGCDDRNEAEGLRGQLVQIPIEAAIPLEKGEYYHFQIVGVEVVTDEGESLGLVAEVLDTGANDVYLVRGPRGEVLIPAIEEVVRELDLEARRMVVTLLPGLLRE
ncbi:MAG TPA: 16S rRNA processing protein RimM [Chloroflexi bacterium]|nr:16S rRNA processing protein RimM [Chloroflexota bacterium]